MRQTLGRRRQTPCLPCRRRVRRHLMQSTRPPHLSRPPRGQQRGPPRSRAPYRAVPRQQYDARNAIRAAERLLHARHVAATPVLSQPSPAPSAPATSPHTSVCASSVHPLSAVAPLVVCQSPRTVLPALPANPAISATSVPVPNLTRPSRLKCPRSVQPSASQLPALRDAAPAHLPHPIPSALTPAEPRPFSRYPHASRAPPLLPLPSPHPHIPLVWCSFLERGAPWRTARTMPGALRYHQEQP